MRSNIPFTSADILRRAIALVATGPVNTPYIGTYHGVYCPWCAIAKAKSIIESELGLTVNSIAGHYDTQLINARWALGTPVVDLSRNEALIILQRALEEESKRDAR